MKPTEKISLLTATSLAVANMVGTGVFTSLGFQLVDLRSPFVLLLLWLVGGFFALCGALVYGELAASLPRSGGEFNFLGKIYHPLAGFLAGWISFVMGFALPIALAAMAFGGYWHRLFPGVPARWAASAVVVLVTAAHLRDLRLGTAFQNIATAFKLILILVFIGAAWFFGDKQPLSFMPGPGVAAEIFSEAFFVSLLFVMFAYAGWNASTYIIDEVENPARNVPLSLVLATGIVALLYLGLNWSFLVAAPAQDLVGQLEVGHVAAVYIFGPSGGALTSGLLCIALISTLSAMTWAGPRVTQAIGQDYRFFARLARTNRHGIPVLAIVIQSCLVLLLIWTADFESLLVFTQFALALCSAVTVAGVFVLRRRATGHARPYSTWFYPWTPALFLLLSLVMAGFTFLRHPLESIAGLLTVLLGVPVYLLAPERANKGVPS